MMSQLQLLFLFGVFASSLGTPYQLDVDLVRTLVVGGQPAQPGQFPYQIQLQARGEHDCGGALLNEYWVMTAGHCMGRQLENYTVVAGQHNVRFHEGYEQNRTLKRSIRHPDYSIYSLANDIALLEVNEPFVYGDRVQPITLPKPFHNTPVGTPTTIAGWGLLDLDDYYSEPEVLHYIDLPTVEHDYCQEAYKDWHEFIKVTDRMICTGVEEGGVDSCRADSGGPVICHEDGILDYACGIVSFGEGCGVRGYPGVNTKVSHYVEWITSIINN